MMDAAAAHATSERRAAELLAARELVKSWKRAATAAEEHAEAARRAEVEAATASLAPRMMPRARPPRSRRRRPLLAPRPRLQESSLATV